MFLFASGADPFEVYGLIWTGAFASWFSLQNTLLRAAPLLLVALCTALPARLGLVIIGGEGAIVLGGLAAAAIGVLLVDAPYVPAMLLMAAAAMVAGAALIALAGWLRHARGVNETISSLLLTYIAVAVFNHLVEGPLRDPASLNKPSTASIGDQHMIGAIPGTDVHWGLAIGVVVCLAMAVLMRKTTFGFATRMVGGNVRAARMAGLPIGRLVIATCAMAGAAGGLAGMIEVAAIHGKANASLNTGYGFTGILVAFLARHEPSAVIPVAILFGGINAAGGLLQRRMDLPDATVLVLQGILFVVLLASETLRGRSMFGGKA
ncbi:MAG: ABC transporter permease [Alphaproteobacteria bacterium]|nr:ABC transporter permease [Alphaproteobacteria bacterium]MCW5742740.1 ABC transporter permease [Alphaproteobacteria bacterium]